MSWWRGCLADVPSLELESQSRQLDFRPIAEAAAVCHSTPVVTWIAHKDAWSRGFLQAALKTPREALQALSDQGPVVRTGAAQGFLMRTDVDQLLPDVDQLRTDRLPNPEAATVRPLAIWRRHLAQVMGGFSPEARVVTAKMLIGTDGWTSYCATVVANPGLQGWLLDIAMNTPTQRPL